MTNAVQYDHLELSAQAEPYAAVNRLREECPVAHVDGYGGFWVLTRYADVCAAARDPERFTSTKGITIPHHGFPITLPPIELDPPLHKTFRQPITDLFSQARMAGYEDELRDTVTRLIDDFIEVGRADLARDLTIPLPAIFAVRLLGLPKEDVPKFVDWAVRIMSVNDDQAVVVETFTYFNELFERAKAGGEVGEIPRRLLAIAVDGALIDNVQFCGAMAVLFTAGLDTTANAGAYSLEILARRPDLRDELLADLDGTLPAAIDELLRYITPLPALARTTTTEVEVDGQTIPAGERVQFNYMAANRDPERFPDPDTLDLRRDAKTHVAFGHGVHRCLGQHLARVELTVLLREVLTRLPDFALIPDEPVQRYPGMTRGISSIPATFTPGPKLGPRA